MAVRILPQKPAILPKDFYVYAHAKATTGEIFYYGKGHGRRAWSHHSRSNLWKSVVAKHGLKVIIIQDGLQEWAALELECDMIALRGRRDLGRGSLINFTDGGDGTSGAITPDHVRKIQSETFSRLNADPEFKEKVRAINLARLNTPEAKQQMREFANAMNADPKVKAAASARMNAMHADPEFRAAHALRMKNRWGDPIFREKNIAATKARNADPSHKAANALLSKARYEDPIFMERFIASTKAAAANPKRKAKLLEARKASIAVRARKIMCKETKNVFASGAEAARWLEEVHGYKNTGSSICKVCNGNQSQAYGYTWAYA